MTPSGIFRGAALLAASLAFAQQVPRPAADLTISYLDGHKARLADYRGKVVLLACISTTCPHCKRATAVLTRLQNEFGPKGLQVLETALDHDAQTSVPGFVSETHPSFPVGYITVNQAWDFLALPDTARLMYPIVAIIDRGGNVRFQATGADAVLSNEDTQEASLRQEIDKVLKEPGHGRRAAAK